ncbi:MAG: ribosome silencing factor [Ignavibacteriales bacterium]|nr:ribosome silencing factor [Ignavibacteriales bacterium]
MTTKLLAKKTAQFALIKKAADVVILDLHGLTSMADFFVVCSGDSDTQVRAIADAVEEEMAAIGDRVWHKEGYREGQWILLDFVDVVVHVFHKDTRSFYNLEKLWGDAPTEHVEDARVKKTVRRKSPSTKRSKE